MAATKILESHRHERYDRLQIQLRSNSRFYQALTFLDGKKRQHSLKTAQLGAALKLAAEWYKRELRASVTHGRQHPIDAIADPTMAEVWTAYLENVELKRRGRVKERWGPIASFWRALLVKEIDARTFREFYKWRRRGQGGRVVAHTLHKDVSLIRQLLKHAAEHGTIERLPTIPAVGRIIANPRPWLTPDEWKRLIETAEQRIMEVMANDRLLEQRVDLFELMQFLVLSMCRVGEALDLRYRDCRLEEDALIAQVTGKRGTRTFVAPVHAMRIVKERLERLGEQPDLSERVFPVHHRDAFRELPKAASLYRDAQGFTRNMKSLRATAISFRLLEPNANILVVARNAGTSVAMIDQFYARRLSAEMHRNELSATLTVAGDTIYSLG
jgi:integrase